MRVRFPAPLSVQNIPNDYRMGAIYPAPFFAPKHVNGTMRSSFPAPYPHVSVGSSAFPQAERNRRSGLRLHQVRSGEDTIVPTLLRHSPTPARQLAQQSREPRQWQWRSSSCIWGVGGTAPMVDSGERKSESGTREMVEEKVGCSGWSSVGVDRRCLVGGGGRRVGWVFWMVPWRNWLALFSSLATV